MARHLLILFLGSILVSCLSLDPQSAGTKPTAAFAVANDGCIATCTINFTNQSKEATSYLWEFGDKTTSIEVNPVKQFTIAGTYTVKLTATGQGGTHTTQQTVTVKEPDKPSLSIQEPETVAIPGGTFQMGSADENETKPVQSQIVTGFRLGKYEITVRQYRDFCTAAGRSFPATPPTWDWVDDAPIVNVTWADAIAYCQWLSTKTTKRYRLPTEAEWEYAARGGENFTYAGSNNPNDVAWNINGYSNGATTMQVGKKKPNGFGTYDMSGNVEEWCSSYYGPYPFTPPNGPATGSTRVVRGGWGISFITLCTVTSRHNIAETYKYWWTGFRIVQDI